MDPFFKTRTVKSLQLLWKTRSWFQGTS